MKNMKNISFRIGSELWGEFVTKVRTQRRSVAAVLRWLIEKFVSGEVRIEDE